LSRHCLPPVALSALSLHDALPIYDFAGVAHTLALVWFGTAQLPDVRSGLADQLLVDSVNGDLRLSVDAEGDPLRRFDGERVAVRSEEHTSELQSRFDLVCRLLLET